MITKTLAVNAKYRQELFHRTLKDSQGNPVKCRVNGSCQTWKTRPREFKLPVKHGLKQCFYIDESNAADWGTDPRDNMALIVDSVAS